MVRLPISTDTLKVAAAALGGGALAATFIDQQDLPDGPARRPARTIIEGIEDIPDAQVMNTEMVNDAYTIEFHLPDRDSKFSSSVALDLDTGRIREATVRLGPLGHQSEVDRQQWQDFEGQFTDVVLDAAPSSVMDTIDGHSIDLGDKWVSDMVRPHVRFHEERDGYDIPPGVFVDFLESLADRFESQFGRYEDRLYGEFFREGY